MSDVKWAIRAREFTNCNCAYGCPSQFNALPTKGDCQAVVGMQIDEGFHGSTRLDGLRFAGIFAWPGPIHEGNREACVIIDENASPAQRESLLRILTGEDTEPGATIFQVFAATFTKLHDPIFAPIEFEVDIDARTVKLVVPGITAAHGEPILNPVTKQEHHARIEIPNGFEYAVAEVGRGWTRTTQPMRIELAHSYGQFAHIHLSQSGVIH